MNSSKQNQPTVESSRAIWSTLAVAVLLTAAGLFWCDLASAGPISPGGLGSTDLQYWFDAGVGVKDPGGAAAGDGDFVGTWTDGAGVGDAVQATGARQPIYVDNGSGPNGRAVLLFDDNGGTSSSSELLVAPVTTVSNNFSVFVVARQTDSHQQDAQSTTGTGGVSGQAYLLGARNSGSDGGAGISVGVSGNTSLRGISVYEHGAGYMPSLATYTGAVSTGYNLFGLEYSSRQPTIFLNTSSVHTGLTSVRNGGGGQSFAPTEIGGGTYGGLTGQMAEAILYDRLLNDAERTVVENYLNSKYDLDNDGALAFASNVYDGDLSANGDYDSDVFGIGQTGGEAFTTSASAGFGIDAISGLDNGDFMLAGHKVESNTELDDRWDRTWYLDNRLDGGDTVDLTFDWSDAGLGSANPEFLSLLYSSSDGGEFSSIAIGSLLGDTVTFTGLSASQLADGYYTLGAPPVPEPSSLLLLGGLGIVSLNRSRKRRAQP